MVKILKIIFGSLIVDTLFWFITVGLFIAWIVNGNNNFTGFLLLVAGYVFFNIYNKTRVIINIKLKGGN